MQRLAVRVELPALPRDLPSLLPPAAHGMRGFAGRWKGLQPGYSHAPVQTGVPHETLRKITTGMTRVPDTFSVHPKIARQLANRLREFEAGQPVDWGFAESLAFASLLVQGVPIRLTGQDTERGTFSVTPLGGIGFRNHFS